MYAFTCDPGRVLRADLVPVYSFGENELFPQVLLSEGSVGRRLQALFKQVMGFAPCLVTGGRWLFLPYRRPVTTVGELNTICTFSRNVDAEMFLSSTLQYINILLLPGLKHCMDVLY